MTALPAPPPTPATDADRMAAAVDRVLELVEAPFVRLDGQACLGFLDDGGPVGRTGALFGLSPAELAVLVVAAGAQTDPAVGARCAAVTGQRRRPWPSLDLMRRLPGCGLDALAPTRPLRYWRLVEPVGPPEMPLVERPLVADERVVHALLGHRTRDPRLAGWLAPTVDPPALDDGAMAAAGEVAHAWTASGGRPPVVNLYGADAGTRVAVAAYACQRVGLGALVVDRAPPDDPADFAAFTRLVCREAALDGAAVVLDDAEEHAARRLAEQGDGAVVLGTRRPLGPVARGAVAVRVPDLDRAARRVLWARALAPSPIEATRLDQLTDRFRLPPGAVRQAAHLARGAGGALDPDALWRHCLATQRPALDQLAHRVEPKATWDDLVLPAEQRALLDRLCAEVRRRAVVFEAWGMGLPGRGLSATALFSGPSGTGKTLAGEVVARELGLDLYVIDLSAVVDKYVGESSKRLRAVFDAAEAGTAVLLFDEADALFGRRTDVRDAHDRYANVEVSYLLQRLEAFTGPAILTTNLRDHIDPAFLRRIGVVVEFPFPDAGQRAEIWRRMFPSEAPTEDIDIEKLARLGLAGGHIRAIAVAGAFLAADEGSPIGMRHLLAAAEHECAKLGRAASGAETKGWV